MSQGSLAQTGRAVEQYMVQRFVPALSRRDSYVKIVLNFGLPDEVLQAPGTETGLKWRIFSTGLT
jgi:hypothetical protein